MKCKIFVLVLVVCHTFKSSTTVTAELIKTQIFQSLDSLNFNILRFDCSSAVIDFADEMPAS